MNEKPTQQLEEQQLELEQVNENNLVKELDDDTQELVTKIIKEKDIEQVKDLTKLFNVNQVKKNLVRVLQLNDLLDMINNQVIERFTRRPDAISNKELLDYMQAVQTSIDKSQKNINTVDTSPLVQINNNKNEINLNVGSELDREGREKVLSIVQSLMQLSQEGYSTDSLEEPLIVDLNDEEN